MEYIKYEDFKKMDIRIGTIKSVEAVEGADKLYKCMVDTGDFKKLEDGSVESVLRQIISGIREFFPDAEKLVGKQVLYVVNLEPRTIRGVESHGMLMAVDGKDGAPVFLIPDTEVASGSKVR